MPAIYISAGIVRGRIDSKSLALSLKVYEVPIPGRQESARG